MKIEIHDVAPRRAMAIEGTGEPGGPEFEAAIGTLYAAAGRNGGPWGPLEALWDQDWRWTLLLTIPDGADPVVAPPVEVRTIEEGTVVEALHVGPWSAEAATVAAMDEFAADLGYVQAGPHHEIYLSDPGAVPPEELRTVLRHPVRAAAI